jgi:DNA repair protein RecO (recombination protein O)
MVWYGMAMQNIVTPGIILKRVEYGEADRILTIYTRELGKISAIAKGSRKPTSRKSGHLEVGNIINFEFAPGKDLYIMTSAKTETYYDYKDLSAMRKLFLWLEIIDKIIHDSERNANIYEVIIKGLRSINVQDIYNRLAIYELELYSTSGYQLEVQQCVVGREELAENDNFIDIRLGGIVCKNHNKGELSINISANGIKLLRLIQECDINMLERIKLDDNLVIELEKVAKLQRYEIIGKKMKVEL